MGMGYLKVTQVKSRISEPPKARATLDGLGLLKNGQTRILEDTPAVRGMLRKVSHLVRIEEAPGA